jgi:predicted metalloprotease
MLWKGRRQSDNVEDQRGQGGGLPGGFGRGGPGQFRIPIGGRAGGGGISGIIILVVIFFALKAFGIDPMQILSGEGGLSDGSGQITQSEAGAPASDEMKQFVSTVLAETEDVWTGIFQANGLTYEDPKMVLFSGQIRSACGFASSASGPFYCPGDHKVYIDLAFYSELRDPLGAPRDFAQAYLIAHEIGHHLQKLDGTSDKVHLASRSHQRGESGLSVRLELQADCYAGVWAHDAQARNLLEVGDIDEALTAAAAIGDDRLQMQSQGTVAPDSFTHGTSAQRVAWFRRGFDSGDPNRCDTFSAGL